eukprot:7785297-Alexandrium_andersonii.AAC.1
MDRRHLRPADPNSAAGPLPGPPAAGDEADVSMGNDPAQVPPLAIAPPSGLPAPPTAGPQPAVAPGTPMGTPAGTPTPTGPNHPTGAALSSAAGSAPPP